VPEVLDQMEAGYVQVQVDQQPYMQGFMPVMQVYLAATVGLAPSDIDTGRASSRPRTSLPSASCPSRASGERSGLRGAGRRPPPGRTPGHPHASPSQARAPEAGARRHAPLVVLAILFQVRSDGVFLSLATARGSWPICPRRLSSPWASRS
jgi:hypothetical protein